MPISGEIVFIQKMNQETRLKLESENMAYEKDVKARKIAPYTIKADHTQSKSELHQLQDTEITLVIKELQLLKLVLGQLPPRKIAPNPNFNVNPKPNPNPNRGRDLPRGQLSGHQYDSSCILKTGIKYINYKINRH